MLRVFKIASGWRKDHQVYRREAVGPRRLDCEVVIVFIVDVIALAVAYGIP